MFHLDLFPRRRASGARLPAVHENRDRALRCAVLTLALLAPSPVAASVCDVWGTHGPYAGTVNASAADPTDADTVYAGTSAGVFKTTDDGLSWELANSGLEGRNVSALAVNPSSPNTLFAGLLDALARSDDGGRTWQIIDAGLVDPMVLSIVFVPGSFGQTILVAVHDEGVLKSIDGGASWSLETTGLEALGLTALAVDPITPSIVYAGVEESGGPSEERGVYKSTDTGETWSRMVNGLTDNVYSLAIHPITPTTVFAGTSNGTFKTVDGAATWTASNTDQEAFETIFGLIIDPGAPDTVYAGADDLPFYVSNDAGDTWSSGSGIPFGAESRTIALTANGTLLAGLNGRGVFRSTDSGATWLEANQGIAGTNLAVFAAHPTDPEVLFTGGSKIALSKSIDGGLTWALSDTGVTGGLESIAVDHGGTAYVSTGHDVFKSTDGGASWTSSGTGLTQEVLHLAISPSAPEIIYGGADDLMFKTTNSGGNWIDITNGLPSGKYRPTVHPTNEDIVYTRTQDTMYRSTNGGATWVQISNGLPVDISVEAIAIDPQAPDTVFIGTFDEGAFRTTDGGATWNQLNLGAPEGPVWSFAIEPETGRIVAGVGDGFMVESTNGGVTWQPLVENLFPARVNWMTFAPGGLGRLHAATTRSTHRIALDDIYETIGSGLSDDVCFGKTLPLGRRESRRHCDEDWVGFSGDAGLTYRIETSGLSLSSDTFITLEEDCSGVVLASDDDSGVDLGSRLDFEVLSGGIFDVRIRQSDDSYDAEKSYDIRIIVAPFFEDGFETGDTSAWTP